MKKETIYKITSVLLLSFPLIAFAAISHPTGTTENIVGGIFTLLGSIAAIIAVVFIALGYAGLTEWQVPVLRAALLLFLYYWAQLLGRKFDVWRALVLGGRNDVVY